MIDLYPDLSGKMRPFDLENPVPGVYICVPHKDYLAANALSRSDLKKFKKSKEDYRDGPEFTGNKGTSLGTMYHGWLMERKQMFGEEKSIGSYRWYTGGDMQFIEMKKDKRTKVYKEAIGEYTEERLYTMEELNQLRAMEEYFKQYKDPYKVVARCPHEELVIIAKCPATDLILKCKIDLPWIDIPKSETGIIFDFKTSHQGLYYNFMSQCRKYGYDLQPGFYTYLCAITPGLEHMREFSFIVQQTEEPFLVREYPVGNCDELRGACINKLIEFKEWKEAGEPVETESRMIFF